MRRPILLLKLLACIWANSSGTMRFTVIPAVVAAARLARAVIATRTDFIVTVAGLDLLWNSYPESGFPSDPKE